MMMRAPLITLGSIVLTTAVISNAYFQKKQFYPSVVYITKSNPSMAVIYIQAFVLVLLMGKLVRKVFFGQLRAAEMEHLIERSWYAVTETCLAFTVFRDDFSPKFVALFTLLLFLKCFHWLAEDRVDYMERSPVISWLFHIRVVSLLVLLGGLDYIFVGHAYHSTLTKGASVQLVFGFEYAILFTVVMNILVKYLLHTIDLQRENPWENKAVYLLYTELLMGFFKVVLYLTFMTIMIKIHTFPLFAIRPMYLSMRAFKKAVNDVIMSRRAIRNMNTLYPDATANDLAAADNVCIICREEMNGSGGSKKLPCNHIFHASCLRSWFQRQQTCPTCRMDVLRGSSQGLLRQQQQQQQQQGAQAAQQPGQQGQPVPGLQPQAMPNWPGMVPGGPFPIPFAFMQAQQQQQQQQQQQPSAPPGPGQDGAGAGAAGPGTQAGTSSTSASRAQQQQVFLPPFPLLPFCFFPPPPVLPAGLDPGLTMDDLRAMEGQERENVEARIRVLRNIQTLLDAAVLQMEQYSSLVATLRTTEANEKRERETAAPSNDSQGASESKQSQNGGAATSSQPSTSRVTPNDSNDPHDELRRRRLQRFSFATPDSNNRSNNNNNNTAAQQDDDVD